MRRGVRGMARGSVLAAVAMTAAGPATAAPMRVHVRPAEGGPHTTFRLSFRLPSPNATFTSVRRTDTLSVSGPRHAGCEASTSVGLRASRRRSLLRVALKPRRRSSWCTGAFRGVVVQQTTIACPPRPARVCPLVEIAPQTIGRFRFTVKGAPGSGGSGGSGGGGGSGGSGGSGTGPVFAGLVTATYCTGLHPVIQPLARSFALAWNAATDPSTPSSQIVYDVYESTTPGGENYATPKWTTSAGATQFVTPYQPITVAAYFVVRARDPAGHEDANTAEVQAVNQCAGTQ